MILEKIAGAMALKTSIALWAVIGALLSLRFAPAIVTWPGRALVVVQSFAVSTVATPYVAEVMEASAAAENAIAAGIGVFGISMCDAVMRAVRETNLPALVAGWLKKPGT